MIPFSPYLADCLREVADASLRDKVQRQTCQRQSPGNRKLNAALSLENNNFRLNGGQDIGDFAYTGIARVRKPLLTRRPHCDLKGSLIDIEPRKYSSIHRRTSF